MEKKGQFYTEALPAILLSVFMGLILALTMHSVNTSKADLEKSAPNATEKFPAAFVHSFLLLNISADDAESVGLDSAKRHNVKKLLWLNTQESRELADKYRKKYLKKMAQDNSNGYDMHDYYQKFSADRYDPDELLYIDYSLKYPADLQTHMNYKNYFFYFLDRDSNMIHVHFKNPKGLIKSPPVKTDIPEVDTEVAP